MKHEITANTANGEIKNKLLQIWSENTSEMMKNGHPFWRTAENPDGVELFTRPGKVFHRDSPEAAFEEADGVYWFWFKDSHMIGISQNATLDEIEKNGFDGLISTDQTIAAIKPKQCFDVVLSRLVEETLTVTIMAASEAEAIELANAEADTGERDWETGFYGGERRTVESVTVNPAQKMTIEEWIAHYKPITKPDATGTDFSSDFMHETYGADLAAVQAANQKCVWTLIDPGTEGETTEQDDDDKEIDDDQEGAGFAIVNGARFVNRLNYFITEVPFDDSNGVTMEVAY
jgi:hypothetical protein